jgi:hypothetical protein
MTSAAGHKLQSQFRSRREGWEKRHFVPGAVPRCSPATRATALPEHRIIECAAVVPAGRQGARALLLQRKCLRWEIFGIEGGNSAGRPVWQLRGPRKPWSLFPSTIVEPGVGLALRCGEYLVFRAALLSIVLLLAVGQNVALLCITWCDAHTAAATECHYENSSTTPSVTGDEHCDNATAAAAVLREDVRRGVSSWEANQASVVRFDLALLTIDAPGQVRRARWLEKPPLSTALRI